MGVNRLPLEPVKGQRTSFEIVTKLHLPHKAFIALLMAAAVCLISVIVYSRPIAQASDALPALKLCRSNVVPCQQDLNLPVGGEVSLDLVLSVPEAFSISRGWPLLAWYLRLLLGNPGAVELEAGGSPPLPVQETGLAELALHELAPLSPEGNISDAETATFLRLRNQHQPATGLIEYGINLLDNPNSGGQRNGPRMVRGKDLLLGQLNLRGIEEGRTDIAADNSYSNPLEVLYVKSSSRLYAANLNAAHPLATLNVGPTAERARLRGTSHGPMPWQGIVHPLGGRDITVEFWASDADSVKNRKEKAPVAVFSGIRADEAGNFQLTDLADSIVPPGTYDLRLKPEGALSTLKRGQKIGIGPDEYREPLPSITRVEFGPIVYGDLSGNNAIGRSDLEIIRQHFGQQPDLYGEEPLADFNCDNIIDGQDFSLVAMHFEEVGE